MGILWEHVVLNEIQARLQTRDINYWRDKRGHEVDFVLARRGRAPIAIECKWTATDLDPAGLVAFHGRYPRSRLFVVTSDERGARPKTAGGVEVTVTNLASLMDALYNGSADDGR